MMRMRPALVALAALGLNGLLVGQAFAVTATISVDAARKGPEINPRMYGIFLEEINHGVDGGLYAERISNRAFEDSRPPEGCTFSGGRWKSPQGWDSGFDVKPGEVPHWSLVTDGSARGEMNLETSGGLNENTPYCLRLDVEDASSGRIGVANEGFWGIGATSGEKYALTLYARGSAGPLSVRLEDTSGAPCSNTAKLNVAGGAWKRYDATLKATRTEGKARLVITAASRGQVWLDFVSLFPEKTYKGRKNGLRPDIARMIADLQPGFVRFPGGCVVEGGNIDTAYNWKLTVGPVEIRPERWNAWNYRRTHGMGYYEYLQFCEDLKAEPVWVEFAGQSCLYRSADHVAMEDMGWVVNNFLDAVDYANGPATSKWGAERAKSGHPASFNVQHVEIGNENGMPQYEERYKLIHKTLEAAYPDITYLADYPISGASYDMVDDHYYNSPQWFLNNTHLYDRRDRSGPKVYVGEIAVTSGEGGEDKGNMISALAEGAFLMGMERNADVVKMVSYAPLLAHVNGRSGWHGMIYFDSRTAYGTASYHLWKLFGLNRPSYTVQTDVQVAQTEPPAIKGAVGIGTWDTSAEFKDIRVEKGGQVLYASDSDPGSANWRKGEGNWTRQEGVFRQGEPGFGTSYFGDASWSDYTLTMKARKLAGTEGFLIVFGNKDGDEYWWNVGGWSNEQHALEFNRSTLGRSVRGSVELNRWYDIKVELSGRRIRCYLDGTLIHDEVAPTTQAFTALAGRDDASGDLIVKAINTSAEPMTATVNIAGAATTGDARCIELKSARPSDNNTLSDPTRVVPVTTTLRVGGPSFTHEFPANSLTILRLKSK